jgi:hypothetical protein
MNATAMPRNSRAKNPFEVHGIDQLTPSMINTWISCPSLWIMETLLKRVAPKSCAVHRQHAARVGVAYGLANPYAEASECADKAFAKYDELAAASGDPKRDDERAALPGMIENALIYELRQLGKPIDPGEPDHRSEILLEDVSVPIVGFADFVFPDEGVHAVLKTTYRIPKEFGESHARAASVIQRGSGNAQVRYVYSSEKKSSSLTLDADLHTISLNELRHSALRLERFLSLSTDAHELAAIVTPDYASFYWNDPATRALGRKTYGF